jgi:hypothetical protein
MKNKKIFVLAIGFGIALTSIGTVSATESADADSVFVIPDDGRVGLMGAYFNDQETGEKTSYLIDNEKWKNTQVNPTCSSLQDPSCKSDTLTFRANIPLCSNDADLNCIEEVGAIKENGTKVVGKLKQYFPLKAQNEYQGDPKFGLPSGVAGAVVNIPGISHKGGEDYFVTFQLSGSVTKSAGSSSLDGFSARIIPVSIVPNTIGTQSTCFPEMCDTGWVYHEPLKGWGDVGGGAPSCISTSIRTKECAEIKAFPENLRFYLKSRLNISPTGWLHGRFADPEITFETKDGVNQLSVEALPIRVPVLYKAYIWPDVPQTIQDGYDRTTGFFKLGNTYGVWRIANSQLETDPARRNFISTPRPSGKNGIEELKLWLPVVGDKATSMASLWSIRSLRQDESAGSNQCFDSKTALTGLVTTNATQYSAGPPTLEKSEGTLNYSVAAPHFNSKGDVFKGSYDLVMRSDVARCVYGFSKAPINAAISITSADGTPQVATTLIGERKGWLYLQAKNFEFSAPVIKAKLTQDVEPTPNPTPSASPTVKPVTKKTSITCVKGKTVKKVTAVSPKCPSGFKKK